MRYSDIFLAASLAAGVVGSPSSLFKRQTCGPGVGSCPQSQCCSGGGYCGTTSDYCKSPACQIAYSGGTCDSDVKPCGGSTETIARSKSGSAPYDTIITSCTQRNVVALTFDDGPSIYTNALLDKLKSFNVKATFFITGNNNGKGRIDDPANPWASTIRRAYDEGHQIASHTWSHLDLSAVDNDRRTREVVYNEMALRNVLGFFPTYLRPPSGSCTRASGCLDRLTSLGYHVVNWDLDTKDYINNTPDTIQKSKDLFDQGFDGTASRIVLTHDIQQTTVDTLAEYIINAVQAKGYKFVTVGECLGDDKANWYVQASGASLCSDSSSCSAVGSAPSSTAGSPPTSSTLPTNSDSGNGLKTSTDGTCGDRSKGLFTCQGSRWGNCCSYNGFCGSTSAFCDGGCQPNYGVCNRRNPGDPLIVSANGLCGGTTSQTCQGSVYGNCCSKYGNCGKTDAYCKTGCQSGFGTCS